VNGGLGKARPLGWLFGAMQFEVGSCRVGCCRNGSGGVRSSKGVCGGAGSRGQVVGVCFAAGQAVECRAPLQVMDLVTRLWPCRIGRIVWGGTARHRGGELYQLMGRYAVGRPFQSNQYL
jgi:hypothetical protein